MTRIKICGLRTSGDIEIVNEAEPDLAGFIFDPSRKRYVAPEKAARLREQLKPGIRTVGVFVNPPMEMVLDYLERCPVDYVQLHGQETNDWIRKLQPALRRSGRLPGNGSGTDRLGESRREDKAAEEWDSAAEGKRPRIIKAFTIRSGEDLKSAEESAADLVLLDHGIGGTGERFDWSLIRNLPRPFLLAGGLNPENVVEAICRTHPWGVDASSGLEGPDGHKDAEKVRQFVAAVRKADD